jgi:hypothetical protein
MSAAMLIEEEREDPEAAGIRDIWKPGCWGKEGTE